MMYRVTRKETYVAWVSANDEDHVEEILSEMSNGDCSWLSDPDDTEVIVELMREE